jgi:hypothetical protein
LIPFTCPSLVLERILEDILVLYKDRMLPKEMEEEPGIDISGAIAGILKDLI